MNLSKSLYTIAIQCPKALWLKKYKPEVLTPTDEFSQAKFNIGHEVGELACDLLPNGIKVDFNSNLEQMVKKTKELIDSGYTTIYEAAFYFENILVIVDILEIDEDAITIYEVKSSTSLKDIYLHDVSIQYYTLKNLGYKIKSTNVIYLNNNYVRDEELDLKELFVIEDVTKKIELLQKEIPSNLQTFENYLSNKQNEPNIDIGKHCRNPYDCTALDYCWKYQRNIPDYSIFNIFNLGSKKQIELYNQGITNIDNIPDDFEMTTNQKEEVNNYKSKQTYIDKIAINKFLKQLSYPIYYLDFETYQQSIPLFKGISAYEQIPFQYSLHIEYEDGTLEHKEFLAHEDIDSRYELAKSLVENISSSGTVLAYNMSFEKTIIRKLSNFYGEFAYDLMNIDNSMQDLMTPFQKRWFVTPAMKGSYSIKYILPALVPEFEKAYKDLELVHNGSEAMNVYANLKNLSDEEKIAYKKALLEYCKLDTLAMVRILEVLKNTVF